MVSLNDLVSYTDELLKVKSFEDYCHNGVQVRSNEQIGMIVTGVSANLELFHKAREMGADAVLVHHGMFWKKDPMKIDGVKTERIYYLLNNDLTLLGYHLPLDAHEKYGNNAQLAELLGMKIMRSYDFGQIADFSKPKKMKDILTVVEKKLGFPVKHFVEPPENVKSKREYKRFAVMSGGATDYFERTLDMDVDGFITGEIREFIPEMVKESGKAFISLGHYDSEKFGVQALGEHLEEKFDIGHFFVDVPNEL